MDRSVRVSLGDVLGLIRSFRKMRDELENRLRIEVPSELVKGATSVVIYPKFTDGYVVTVAPGDREIKVDVWLTHIKWGIQGREVSWGDYRITNAGGKPVLEIISKDGNISITLEKDLVDKIESMSNSAFTLHLVDWFVGETAAEFSELTGEPIEGLSDYSSLRFMDEFVERIMDRLRQLKELRKLRESILRIEEECSRENHGGRGRVNVAPVGTYMLCPTCRFNADARVEAVLRELGDKKITINRDTWENALKRLEAIRESIAKT